MARNFVAYDTGETVAVIDGIVCIFGHSEEHGGWYVLLDGAFQVFTSGHRAAQTFRLLVDVALTAQEERRRDEEEPPFVLGRVTLEAADWLPV